MKFLITGSSSYVGKSTINHLLKNKNFKVVGTSRTNPKIINDNFKWIKHDLSKKQLKINKKIDYVVHIAGEAWMGKKTKDYVMSNVMTTLHLSEMTKTLKPKAVFYISSRDVYGDVKTNILAENNPIINPIIYGHTKYLAENLLIENCKTIILRCPSIIGLGTHGWIAELVKKLKRNKKIIFNNTKFNNFIHASEIPKIILKFCKKSNFKTDHYLLGCSNKIMSKKIIEILKKNLNSKSKVYSKKKKNFFYTISIKKLLKIYKPLTVEKSLEVYCNEIKKL